MLEIPERQLSLLPSPTPLTKHFQSASGWLVQVKKELIKPKGRKAANSLQQQKFDFLPSWKAQKGSQSSPPHAIAIILRGQDPLPGSIHCWREWGSEDAGSKVETRGDIKGLSIGNISVFSFPLLNFTTKILDSSPPRTLGLDRKQNLMVYPKTGSVQINSAGDRYFLILPIFLSTCCEILQNLLREQALGS